MCLAALPSLGLWSLYRLASRRPPAGGTMPFLLAFFVLVEGAEYRVTHEQMENVAEDPWVPCEQRGVRGFCRLSCSAKWSYRPEYNDCEMLNQDQLLKRSFGVKAAEYRQLSEDTYSSVRPRRISRTAPAVELASCICFASQMIIDTGVMTPDCWKCCAGQLRTSGPRRPGRGVVLLSRGPSYTSKRCSRSMRVAR